MFEKGSSLRFSLAYHHSRSFGSRFSQILLPPQIKVNPTPYAAATLPDCPRGFTTFTDDELIFSCLFVNNGHQALLR
ncbi:hypothetical protein EUGRSUZ_K03040 [Eucalyptus grandis]|uniref:Uncharacterized protein n=2 Tax=Eucalyptus grandis TaxID=71139 RepID=A0ACC3IYW3_EUCGR|nr:hypothetical protein EUGRSUZ_K03040 [Eucalyptus grandis]